MMMRFGVLARETMKLRLIAAAALVAVVVGTIPQIAMAAPDSSIVVDAKTGKTLYSQAPDSKRYPASLTKMMTLYLLFDALDAHKTSLNATIKVSAHAAAQAPSKLGLKPGETIRVRDAILAIVTRSANDVAVAIAEYLGGTESAFAEQMTRKAHALGMSRTTFRNASGLPNPGQMTTARDMATLGRALQEHHAEYFAYFSTPSFVWKGRRIGNHDRLLGRVDGVNGIKTGYTRASGYNLVSSVTRGKRQIVGVVMGGETGRWRDQRMAGLIEKYIPGASTGARIASVPDPGTAVAAIDTSDLPVPQRRPAVDDGATASIAPPVPAAAPAAVAVADAPRPTASQPVAAPTAIASLVGANSVFALDAADQGQGDASAEDDPSDAASPGAVISGWKIQIAATPSQSSAEDILDQALGKAAPVLAKASPYTEPVVTGDTKLYRARFAGFANKKEARAACAYLTRRDFQCLALND
jgi:D-alanyl-D-alanine carboxypeptidase